MTHHPGMADQKEGVAFTGGVLVSVTAIPHAEGNRVLATIETHRSFPFMSFTFIIEAAAAESIGQSFLDQASRARLMGTPIGEPVQG